MKDGVRKPSGSRASFNSQGLAKNSAKSNFASFSKSNFGKNFAKGKKRRKIVWFICKPYYRYALLE